MKIIFKLFVIALVLCFSSCKDNTPEPQPPGVASLTFPEMNALCTSGNIISPTESSIIFTWNAAANASSYEINIKNLLTGSTTLQATSSNQATITLLRNTPYAWFVVSKSNNTTVTAKSDTWKFYNAGVGAVFYSPFQASLTAPGYGQTVTATTVNLTWTGADVDNDIVAYDVYFGTTQSPPLFIADITTMFANNIAVSAGNSYYWKIVTKDAQGNKSDSGIYVFKVN